MLYNAFRALFVSGAVALTGCASIVSDSKYPVSVSSYPSGANFEIRSEKGFVVSNGVTPSQVILDAGAGYFDGERYTVTYRKEGFIDQSAILDSEVDGWYWGNIGFGGIIGLFIVDPLTGAMYKLPGHVSASLAPEAKPVAAAPIASPPGKGKEALLEELANDKSISYDEYLRRHEIIMRSN